MKDEPRTHLLAVLLAALVPSLGLAQSAVRILDQLGQNQVAEQVVITLGGVGQALRIDAQTPCAYVDFLLSGPGTYTCQVVAKTQLRNSQTIATGYANGKLTLAGGEVLAIGGNFSLNPFPISLTRVGTLTRPPSAGGSPRTQPPQMPPAQPTATWQTTLAASPGLAACPAAPPAGTASAGPGPASGNGQSYDQWHQYWQHPNVPPSAPPLVLNPDQQKELLGRISMSGGVFPWIWTGIQRDGPPGEDGGPILAKALFPALGPGSYLDQENEKRGWSCFHGVFMRYGLVKLYLDIMLEETQRRCSSIITTANAQRRSTATRSADWSRREANYDRQMASQNLNWSEQERLKIGTDPDSGRRSADYAKQSQEYSRSAGEADRAARDFEQDRKSANAAAAGAMSDTGRICIAADPFTNTELSFLHVLSQRSSPQRVLDGLEMTGEQRQRLQRALMGSR
jgi:hypothetical protein